MPHVVLLGACACGVDDDELAGNSPRLGEEGRALGTFEVAVEVPGEDAIEAAVGKRERERIALDIDGARRLTARLVEHRLALVEADDVAAQVPCEESGTAGDVKRVSGWHCAESLGEALELVLPARPFTLGEETRPEVPVVVLGRAPVVVLLHGPRVRSVLPLESVPNFSEGRDRATIDAIGAALARAARLLDVHADADHNRSVFTVVGEEDDLVEALAAAVEVARARIDLRRHEGAHPRIGAADVVPIVPVVPGDMERARAAALRVGERLGELGLPVFLYAPPERGPAFYRRGGVEELQRRLDAGELSPDFGPARLDPSAGGVIVGARRQLIAFNVNLRGSLEAAKEVAALVRQHEEGGFPGVRALGLELPRAGLVQVSMNVEDWEAAALHEIVAFVEAEAAARGAEMVGSELVGLMPAGAAVAAAGAALRIDGFDASHVLELRLLG